jgi:hypothetical protein
VRRLVGSEMCIRDRQNIDGVIIPTSGDDGSPHENEAHCFSGLMIRLFGKMQPNIYEIP